MDRDEVLAREKKGRGWWEKWKRGFRYVYLRLLRVKGGPEEIAWGMAIGVFVGMTPTVPLHTVLAVLIAFFLGKSKLTAALGVWVANPFVLPFIYLLDYKIGRAVTGSLGPSLAFSNFSISHLLELGWEVSYPMLVGGLIMGGFCALPTYFLTKRTVALFREKRRKRSDGIDYFTKTTSRTGPASK